MKRFSVIVFSLFATLGYLQAQATASDELSRALGNYEPEVDTLCNLSKNLEKEIKAKDVQIHTLRSYVIQRHKLEQLERSVETAYERRVGERTDEIGLKLTLILVRHDLDFRKSTTKEADGTLRKAWRMTLGTNLPISYDEKLKRLDSR